MREEKKPFIYCWRDDLARFLLMLSSIFPLPVVVVIAIGSVLLPTIAFFRTGRASEVVVYAAQDQVYAEPILKEFEKQTGIKVRAIFDSEAVKTVAIANRLLAERQNPQCDVYWGNEELRTRQLAAKNIFRVTNGWAAFGYRSRRLVVSSSTTNFPAPASLLNLTNASYRGRVAMAYPLFGTSATHLLALRQLWGQEAWENWCRALAFNRPFIVDGNSVVVRFVARGEASIGLTDSDDVAASIREGAAIRALPINQETLLIPNTVAMIRDSPNPAAAQRLFEYLQSRAVVQRLIEVQALEGISPAESGATGSTLQPDWERLLHDIETATADLQKLFRR